MKRKPKRVPINWTKQLLHPDDYRVKCYDADRRQHERRYGESADERDGRVCAFVNVGGAGVIEMGHDNRRSDPARQAIVWNPKAQRWEPAPLVLGVTQPGNTLSKQAHLVSQGVSRNRHTGGNF